MKTIEKIGCIIDYVENFYKEELDTKIINKNVHHMMCSFVNLCNGLSVDNPTRMQCLMVNDDIDFLYERTNGTPYNYLDNKTIMNDDNFHENLFKSLSKASYLIVEYNKYNVDKVNWIWYYISR